VPRPRTFTETSFIGEPQQAAYATAAVFGASPPKHNAKLWQCLLRQPPQPTSVFVSEAGAMVKSEKGGSGTNTRPFPTPIFASLDATVRRTSRYKSPAESNSP
jgi:hypothetical protein